jgi:hypothetical protein
MLKFVMEQMKSGLFFVVLWRKGEGGRNGKDDVKVRGTCLKLNDNN